MTRDNVVGDSCRVLVAAAVSAALLSACIVQEAPAPPAYQPAYQPPAYQTPPAYTPPAEESDNAQSVEMQAQEAPPPLPDYEQPPCPEEGYMWTPGYWAFGPGGYYWVPGTWVAPPRVGLLWTPGYWGFVGAVYLFHAGYWGPHVGFYGGVAYGFGYTGTGYAGGHWDGERFAYNRAVTNVNVTVVHNTYNETVVNNVTVNKVSYNGGNGGVHAEATPQERQWSREQHVPATAMQVQHVHEAAATPALFQRANGGRPAIAATPRPGAFTAPGAVAAHGAPPMPVQQQHTFAPVNGEPANSGYHSPYGGQPNAYHPGPPPVAHPQVNAPNNAPRPPTPPTPPVKPKPPPKPAPQHYDPKKDEQH